MRAAGGLFVLGTERHESRRIDNQLRGRSGRQGDPGETRFFIALTDDIMRLFGSERIMNMMDTLGIDQDTPIDQKILSNAIENAQKKVESRNFQERAGVRRTRTQTPEEHHLRPAPPCTRWRDKGNNIMQMVEDVIQSAVITGFAPSDGQEEHHHKGHIQVTLTRELLRDICGAFHGTLPCKPRS